jgi:superfamily II DNA or RNA helicase
MNTKKSVVRPTAHWTALPLWDHQKKAAEMLESYLSGQNKDSALVRMPTGTGKTRVIAIVTRCFPSVKNSLVVCPYSGLRDQLLRDIISDPTKSVGTTNEPWSGPLNQYWPRKVLSLRPSTLRKRLRKIPKTGIVLVATIQTLQQIHSEDIRGYASLCDAIDAVIFDEGHREPAPEWATAVRALGKPTVLFTATPYRNDHLMFSVDQQFINVFTHDLAEKGHYIRQVKFVEENLPKSAQEFTTQLLHFYDSTVMKNKPSEVDVPRVIVRCETRDSVSAITRALKLRNRTALGIHDRFEDAEDKGTAHHVPDPKVRKETFWVHQFKLLEGIDEPAFCLLAIYEPLRNARSLVQQVGRIIRNTKRKSSQYAFVFCRTGDAQKAYWDGYREYEQQFERSPRRYEIRETFDVFTQMQPEYQYYDRDYRQRFGFEGKDIHENFLYKPNAIVFNAPPKIDWKEVEEDLTQEWVTSDLDVRKVSRPDSKTLVFPYVSAHNSPVLRTKALTEIQLGFCILRRSGEFIFFYDSQGGSSIALEDRFTRVSPDKLECLFSGAAAKLSYVSLINSDLGRQSTRRRTVQAHSIKDTAPALLDHAHFASSVTGSSGSSAMLRGQRYVGLSRARIADRSRHSLEYEEYCDWIDSVADELARQRKALAIFDRYAIFSSPPKDPTPINILLDITDVMEKFEYVPDSKRAADITLEVDDICLEIDEDGFFTIQTKSGLYKVAISYEPKRKRYVLACAELEDAYQWDVPGARSENLVHYLNRVQAFRVVPVSRDTVFAYGLFYRPRNPLTGRKS